MNKKSQHNGWGNGWLEHESEPNHRLIFTGDLSLNADSCTVRFMCLDCAGEFENYQAAYKACPVRTKKESTDGN